MSTRKKKTTADEQKNVFQPIVESIYHFTGLPVSVWTPNKKGETLRIVAYVGLPENYAKTVYLALDQPSVGGDALKYKKVQKVMDINTDSRWKYKKQAKDMNWKSAICVPIVVDNIAIGVIDVYAYTKHSLLDVAQILPDFAKQISLTLENAKQTEVRQRILDIASKLQTITENPKIVLNEIVKGACELIGASSAVVYPYDGERSEFHDIANVASYGLKQPLVIPEKPRAKGGMAADVMRKGEVIIANLKEQGPSSYARSSFVRKEGIQAFIGIALKEGINVLGVLYVNFNTSHVFTRQEKDTISLFAHQSTNALNNARLYQQAASQISALEKLHEVGITLTSAPNTSESLRGVLTRIANSAQHVLGADLVDLYQYFQGEDRYDLPPVQIGNRYDKIVSKTVYTDDVIYKIVQNKKPDYIVDSQENKTLNTSFTVKRPDAPKKRFVIREDIKSTAAIPLMVGSEVVGVLFANYRNRQEFSRHQIELIELFAHQAAIAIRNGRMFEQRRVLQDIAKDITGILDIDELLHKILSRSLKLLGCEIGSIALLNKITNQLEFQYPVGKERYLSVEFSKGLIGTAAETRKPVRVGNVNKDNRYIKHVATTRSELDVPMLIGNELIGVLNAESTRFDAFDENSEELAIILAGQAAIAIYNSRLYRESLLRSERLELVRKVAAAVSSATDIKTILQLAVDGLANVIEVKQSAVALFDETGEYANVRVEYLESGCVSALGHRIPLKNNPQIDKILETKHPLIVDDVQNDPIMAQTRDAMAKRKTFSLMVVPIIVDDEVVGTIGVDAVGEKRHFTEEEAELAQAIANQAATALRQLNEQLNDIRAFQEITEQIHQGDLGAVLNLIAERAVELTGAKHGGVWLVNKTRTALEFGGLANKAQYKQSPPNIPLDKTSDNSFSKRVVLSKKSYISGNVHKDKNYKPWYKDTRSELTVPVMYQGRVIGTINVESPIEDRFTEDHHKRLLEAMAGQAAIVVQNARLLDSLNIVNDIGRELTSGIRLKEEEILESILKVGAQDMYIALYNEESGEIRFPLATQKGKRVEYPTRKADLEKRGKTEEIIFTRKPILHKTKKDAKEWYGQPGHEEKVGLIQPSWLGVPMLVGERVLGVLAIYDLEQEHAYDEQDLQVFSSMASQAAIALDNANLYYDVNQKLERRVNAFAALNDIGVNLTSGIRAKETEILKLIYSQAQKLTGAQDMYIALYDEDTEIIRFPLATQKGKLIEYPSRKANMEKRGKTEGIIITRKPILHKTKKEAENWYGQPGYEEKIGLIQPSWLGVPMIVDERLLGVIAVYDLEREYAYDEQDLEVFSLMASQAAIALDNARLYEEARDDAKAKGKLATLGTVMATLQHRINNSFSLIIPSLAMLRPRLDESDETVSEVLDIIERNARYASEIIMRIQKQLQEEELKEVNVNTIVQDVVIKLEESWKAITTRPKVSVILELDDTISIIHGYSGQLAEVFHNLVENAYKVLAKGGEIVISSKQKGDMIYINVSDTGPGIPPQIQNRIFKKPVPSQNPGGGAGLGLWLSSLMLQSISGDINIKKSDSNGTIMVVRLPLISMEEKEAVK